MPFKVLRAFGDAAVLDKEIGLVWEKSGAVVGDFRGGPEQHGTGYARAIETEFKLGMLSSATLAAVAREFQIQEHLVSAALGCVGGGADAVARVLRLHAALPPGFAREVTMNGERVRLR